MISWRMLLFGLGVICCAVLWRRLELDFSLIAGQRWSEDDIVSVCRSWDNLAKLPSSKWKRIVIGFNGNVDLIVNGSSCLRTLGMEPSGVQEDHHLLNKLQDVEQLFSLSVSKGAAIERPFGNNEQFNRLTQAASALEDARWFIGGNAGLMAQKIAATFPDIEVNLVAPVGPRLKALLHNSVSFCASCEKDTDEIHLIMEYQLGEVWGRQQAFKANRVITSYDLTNSRLELLDQLFTEQILAGTRLVILSGLHMLSSETPSFRSTKLAQLAEKLVRLPRTLPVHLELASISDASFLREIFDKILPHVASLGLNEQELSFGTEALGRDGSLGSNQHPQISRVTSMLYDLTEQYGLHKTLRANNRLTRIHFHTLTFHVIITLYDAWSNSIAAVAAGARIASMQACDEDKINPQKVELRLPDAWIKLSVHQSHKMFNSSVPINTWTEGVATFVFSPSLVCTYPSKTVGLGDAISATGLLYSQYQEP